jgi:RNA-binding protein
MALTAKERAKLRSQANDMDTILQIGKGGISDATLVQIKDALKAREMIKIRLLETAPLTPKEASFEIAEQVGCDVVQVIGTKIVLYKEDKKEPKFRKK